MKRYTNLELNTEHEGPQSATTFGRLSKYHKYCHLIKQLHPCDFS